MTRRTQAVLLHILLFAFNDLFILLEAPNDIEPQFPQNPGGTEFHHVGIFGSHTKILWITITTSYTVRLLTEFWCHSRLQETTNFKSVTQPRATNPWIPERTASCQAFPTNSLHVLELLWIQQPKVLSIETCEFGHQNSAEIWTKIISMSISFHSFYSWKDGPWNWDHSCHQNASTDTGLCKGRSKMPQKLKGDCCFPTNSTLTLKNHNFNHLWGTSKPKYIERDSLFMTLNNCKKH